MDDVEAAVSAVFKKHGMSLTRAKTPAAASLRGELAYELCVTYGYTFAEAARAIRVHPRSINRYIDMYLERQASRRLIAQGRSVKIELNEYFNLRGRPALLSTISCSDETYVEALKNSMTQLQRQTIALFYEDHLPAAEIAAIQGVTVPAIRNRLQRIRDRFFNAGLPSPARERLRREVQANIDWNAI